MTGADPTAPRSRLLLALGIGLVVLLLGATSVWYLLLRDTSPPPPSLSTATQGITGGTGVRATSSPATGASTQTGAGVGTGTAGTAVADDATGPTAAAAARETWSIDTSVTSDGGGNQAGFRVREVLGGGIGSVDAVGTSTAVEGSLTFAGATLERGSFTVDLTELTSDRPQRNNPMHRTLETAKFPEATFTIAGPVSLPTAPAEGATLSLDVPGTFTIHGISKTTSVRVDASVIDGVLAIVGTTPFTFADYGLDKPSAQIVVSLEDAGTIELQLYLTRTT